MKHCRFSRISGYFFAPNKKAIPVQAWTGSVGSRSLRLPDFMTNGT